MIKNMKKMLIILLLFDNLLFLKIPPDNFKAIDNPYRNDIDFTTEKDHHIITAIASKEYIDYYKGIFYKGTVFCSWRSECGLYPYKSNIMPIPNYLQLSNINDTNLKELHRYGCTSEYPLNIILDYRREADDSIVSVAMRLTNINEEEVEFQFGVCSQFDAGYSENCMKVNIFDTYTIKENSFLIYTFKLAKDGYYIQSEDFQNFYSYGFNWKDHIRLFIMTDGKTIYLNSYIISVDLFRYVLSLEGHAHNYCTNHGCLSGQYCSARNSSAPIFYQCRSDHCSNTARYFIECSLFGCIPGSFCDDSYTCIECDYQCRTCFSKGYMDCKSCYSIAEYPQWDYYHQFKKGTQCSFEFYPLNKIESYNIDVPIPLSYRVTMEFWIFIHDPTYLTNKDLRSSLSSFILKDFFTFSLRQNTSDYNSVNLMIAPFEFFYPFKKSYTTADDFLNDYLVTYPALQYLNINVKEVTSKWIYVRAGISYTHKKMFINEDEKEFYSIPMYYQNETLTFKYPLRKFYRRYDKTYLRVQGFEYINTDVYVRNLNFYSDYMFNHVNYPNYFNMHLIKTNSGNTLTYPQLMFSIPYTNIKVDPTKLFVHYHIYDSSGQYTDYNKNPNQIIVTEIKSKLIRDYLAPSKNFYRLNFLDFKNKEFSTTDLHSQSMDIECPSSEHKRYCFDDSSSYICQNGYDLITNHYTSYEDVEIFSSDGSSQQVTIEKPITDTQCVTNCTIIDEENKEHVLMRLPNIKIDQSDSTQIKKISHDLCTYECNPNIVESCPSEHGRDIKDFKCQNSSYSYFYQCLDYEKYPPKESGLQFSGTLNTKSIYFPLNQELYCFYIEIWFHTDLLTQEKPPLYTKYFFMTNNHHIYYDVLKQQFILKVFNEANTPSTFNLGQKIYYFGWNHLILYTREQFVKDTIYTTFTVSLANNLIDVGTISGRSTANKICFCNKDNNCCDRVSKVLWFDLYYREIKVWDARYTNYYTMNDYDKYSYIIPGGLLQMYNLTSESLEYNKIIDLRHPNDPRYNAYFPFDDPVINPDGDMNYNIAWNFNWNDLNYPLYIISTKLRSDLTRVEIFETGKCYEGCLKCFGLNKFACYSCQPGYALNGATCTRTSDDLSYYYFVNPLKQGEGLDPNAELELDFQSLDLDTYSTITLFFYIKIYGFTQDQIDLYEQNNENLFKLITLSEPDQFILYYDISSDSVLLMLNGKLQYKYTGVLSNFGSWMPISISAFRSDDPSFRKNFVSMTFNNVLLPYLGFDTNGGLFEKFPFKTFKISKYLIAHFGEITLYDLFIINAYGYAQHKYLKNGKFAPTSSISRNPIIIKTFQMYYIENGKTVQSNEDINESSDTINQNNLINGGLSTDTENDNIGNKNKRCILPEEIIDATLISRIVCKEDYLSYLDQKCSDEELVDFTTPNLPPSCVASASKCENIVQVVKNMASNCDYLSATCDTKSTNSINNLIYTYTPRNGQGDYIICGNAHGLDLARFEPAVIPHITSPTEQFKMEFWFLSQSYVGNHFNSITIEWKDHIKIEVFFNSGTNKYGARCIPNNDVAHTMEFEYEEVNYDQNRWRYIVCGVDATTNKAYMTNLMVENREETSFDPSAPLTEDFTTMTVSENSQTNYGVTYLKELRLWDCYDCASDRAFVTFSRDDPFFGNVVNYFQFESSSGFLQDYHMGYPDPDAKVQFITKTDFNGYGLLDPIPDTPNCNEGGQMYYSIKMGEGCDTMFNFNIFKQDIVFEDIPASRGNSYTMEFWFYVESADNFTEGMNLIYEDHMTISAHAHTIEDQNLDVYCFPQAFRDHLDDVFGDNMKKRYDEAENKAGYTFVNGYSKWNYVRCAYSYDLLKYYINDESPQNIDPEIYFNTLKNDKPFKMFMNNYVKFKMNFSRDNYVRIIIQTINIYRDYIPQTIVTKYTKMDQYITKSFENPYDLILFSVNFAENYDIITDKLKYSVTDYEKQPQKSNLEHFLGDIDSKSYKTYPLYDPFKLCNYGQVYDVDNSFCRSIMQPNNCDKIKTFCIDTSKFFWCPKGQYLDVNNLTCDKDCPAGYTRPPDGRNGYGMCYIKAADKHYSSFPYKNADLKQGTYETKFKCENGYVLVNYNCIPEEKVATSGLYFNSKYKFSNLIASYNKLDVPITNYYVDFWFLFDLSEEYRFNIPNDNRRYTIFIAYPHFLTRFKDKIQYNNGYVLLEFYDVINVADIKYKWNHVVLENYQVDGKTAADTFKYINIYWNNDYNNPVFSLKVNNVNSYALAQIAFCHEMNDAYSICNLGLNAVTYKVFTPYWDDVYYKDIKVWNRNSTAISSINSYGSPLNNEVTMNIITYHPLTIDTIKPGLVKSLVTFMGKEVDLISKFNTEVVYDSSQQLNWVTGFDITLPDKYINSIDVSAYTDKVNTPHFSRTDTSFDAQQCQGNCLQCFSGSEEDCISCKTPFLISGTKCTSVTGFYFKIPTANKNAYDKIVLNQDLSSFKEITITFFMKFLGSIEQRVGIVPILYFYDDKNYLGWDIEKQTYIISVFDDSSSTAKNIYSYNNSRLFIGKWSLFSISLYISDYQSKFPNMIQFMIDENIIEPTMELYEIHKTRIRFNTISINNQMSAVFYDLRIYNKFFIGAYGIGQDIYNSAYGQSFLIKRFEFKSNSASSNNCINNAETNVLSQSEILCIGDNNPYDDPNLSCGTGQFKLVDALNNLVECNTCDSYCEINYCSYNTTKNCTCINDGPTYWLRYDFGEEKQKFYCEKLDSINLNEYNDIVINNIGVGTETGYMVELWFYVESYIDNSNFQGVSITWEHFIKIKINLYQKDGIKIECYPNSDNTGKYITDKSDKIKTWIFYRCLVDKEKKKVSSKRSSLDITNVNLYSGTDTTTSLTIKDNSVYPFGVFLLRELRIYNAKTTILTDNSHLNLDISLYISLINYFKGNFTDVNPPRDILYDTVTKISHPLTRKFSNYPYSYISPDYSELILCEEGFEYKKNPEGIYQCLEVDQDDLLNKLLMDDTVFTPADLDSKIENIYNMAVTDIVNTVTNDTTSVFQVDSDGLISMQDPPISDNYCSQKGMIQIVHTTMVCYCIGDSVGKYCHLKSEEYTTLENMYEVYFNKATKTYKDHIFPVINQGTEEEKIFLRSLNNLIDGNQLFTKDTSFITEFTSWLDKNVIFKIDHCDLDYIKLVDKIFTTIIFLTNTYKAGLMSNNKGTKRDANLSYGQEEEIDTNAVLIKKQLEYLTALCFRDTVDGLWSYYSDNIHVDLFKFAKNGNTNIDSVMKSLKNNKYEPYFQFDGCIDTAKSLDGSHFLNVQYITWIYSPYYHHNTLNHNYTSNYIEIKLYSDSINEIRLDECKDKNNVTFYLTLTNPVLIDIINNNRIHFKEGNMFKSDDRIFTEPHYIFDDGTVSFMTLEERMEKYYFEYLLIFKSMDERKRELISENVEYKNLEDNSYFKCSSSHLSEFLLTYEYNPKPDKILGRFYFLKHFKLYTNSKNLNGNYGFYATILIIALYFINFLIVKLCLVVRKKKLGNKNFLLIEDFLIDYVYPYGNIEGDFFVNKENLNKIYNNNLKFKKEKMEKPKEKNKKDLLKLKEKKSNGKNDQDEVNDVRNRRKNAYLNDNNLMNYGDVKNKKLYEQYYKEINEEGYNEDFEEDEKEDKGNETREGKIKNKNIKNDEEIIGASSEEEFKVINKKNKKSNKKKGNIKGKNNFMTENDKFSFEDNEEEFREVNEFNKKNKVKIDQLIHSLQISNENLRIRILSKMKVNCCEFFCTNLKNRLIFINTFRGNYTYSASIKALCFPLYLLILLFINTFVFICLKDESEYMVYIQSNKMDFIWRCLLPVVLVNIYFFLTRYFYNLDNGIIRYLLYEFKTSKKSFDKHYFAYLKKIRNMMIVETVFFFIMAILTYIFIFGLFAVYPPQGKTMFVSLIVGVVIDLVLSFLVEFFIAILFLCRKNHVIVILLDYLNRLISYKMLSP